MNDRASSPGPSSLVRVLAGNLQALLVSVLLALAAAACGGQDRVDFFPQHDEQIPPDRGRESYLGKLVLKEGCLRAEAPPRSGAPAGYGSLLIIWPRTFTLSTKDGHVQVVDAAGRIAARVGDHVRFGGYPGGPQTVRLHELEKELRTDCPGPYLWAGDEVTAISPEQPTTLILDLPDLDLHFRRQRTYLGSTSSKTAENIGELILDGHCLRLKSEYDDRTYRVGWPPGFTPHVHRGVVHVRNEAGRITPKLGMGIDYSWAGPIPPGVTRSVLGPPLAPTSITVLSESDSP